MASLQITHLFSVLLIISSVRAASISSSHTSDGFWLNNLESGKTFTFAIIPKTLGEAMSVGFYSVDFPYTDCGKVQVEIFDDGYVKREFNKIAIICDADGLGKFTATSGRGFHVVVKMGASVTEGSIKARFQAPSGTSITSERLYG